jgi:hypothetical protein
VGCGSSKSDDDSGGGSGGTVIPLNDCPGFAPCGGDVVGRWKLSSECGGFEVSMPTVPECDGLTSNATSSGDIGYEFRTDGSVALDGYLLVNLDLDYTEACTQALYGVSAQEQCDTLDGTNQNSSDQSGSVDASFSCQLSGTTCSCHVRESIATNGTTLATYTISGNQITLIDPSDGSTQTSDYCVEGNQLKLRAMGAAEGSYGILRRL